MSGFVALLETGGRPVQPRLLRVLTAAMAYRGPDARATWCEGVAGLGHAAFQTLEDAVEPPQPLSLDGKTWIVADARIDDRAGLARRLAAAGRAGLEAEPDAALILHAYEAWGRRAPEQLLGDFAFAIWDEPQQTLFCARDHMGVKPLYYSHAGSTLLVGNTIECLRAHPGVSDRLEDSAIADYLLFGCNRHPELTSFADIGRLPPAHSLTWQPSGAPVVERYWRLHVTEPIRYQRQEEYVEHFDELFRSSVEDRVRGRRAAVLMSGGLDSTSVAAVVRGVMQERHDNFDLQACTFTYEQLVDDTEPEYARRMASALEIPLHEVALDGDTAADWWGPGAAWSAEPNELPASARMVEMVSRTTPGTRVAFTGQGGDPTLHLTPADAAHRASRDGWMRTAAAMLGYRWTHGHFPRAGLRTHMKRRLRGHRYEYEPVFPPWLRSDLAKRLDLRRRHDTLVTRRLDEAALRPEAELQLAGPDWSFFLECYDAGRTGFLAEYRHPFLDVRVLEFLLALPVIPWMVEKEILRRAMRTHLPESLLTRRKAPLGGFPVHSALLRGTCEVIGLSSDNQRLAEFIDVERFLEIARSPERLRASEYELITRPLGLALWLDRLETGRPRATEKYGGSGQHEAAEEAISEA